MADSLKKAALSPYVWSIVATVINVSWMAFGVFAGLADKGWVTAEITAAVNVHDHGYADNLKPDPQTQHLLPPHHDLFDAVAKCTNTDTIHDGALSTLRERAATLENELVIEIGSRVRWQAAAAEPDARKRMSAGKEALDRYNQAVNDWPCLQKTSTAKCTTPQEAANRALETRPPR